MDRANVLLSYSIYCGSWEESLCVVSIRKPNSLNDLNDSFISFQLILAKARQVKFVPFDLNQLLSVPNKLSIFQTL